MKKAFLSIGLLCALPMIAGYDEVAYGLSGVLPITETTTWTLVKKLKKLLFQKALGVF